jgi:hypothetical protein
LGAKVINFNDHPGQQGFGRECAYSGSLEGLNLLALASHLEARAFNFGLDMGELHGNPTFFAYIEQI